jgi:hypothetical protein
MQRLLNLPAFRRRHLGFRRQQARRRQGSWCCDGRGRRCGWRGRRGHGFGRGF